MISLLWSSVLTSITMFSLSSFAVSPGRSVYTAKTDDGRVLELVVLRQNDDSAPIFTVKQISPALKQIVLDYQGTVLGHSPLAFALEFGALKVLSNEVQSTGNSFPIGLLTEFYEPLSKHALMSVKNSAGELFTFQMITE